MLTFAIGCLGVGAVPSATVRRRLRPVAAVLSAQHTRLTAIGSASLAAAALAILLGWGR